MYHGNGAHIHSCSEVSSLSAPFNGFLRLNADQYTLQRALLPTMQSSWPQVYSLKERQTWYGLTHGWLLGVKL